MDKTGNVALDHIVGFSTLLTVEVSDERMCNSLTSLDTSL